MGDDGDTSRRAQILKIPETVRFNVRCHIDLHEFAVPWGSATLPDDPLYDCQYDNGYLAYTAFPWPWETFDNLKTFAIRTLGAIYGHDFTHPPGQVALNKSHLQWRTAANDQLTWNAIVYEEVRSGANIYLEWSLAATF